MQITKRFRRVGKRTAGVSRVTWFRFGVTLYVGEWIATFGVTDGKPRHVVPEADE